MAKPSREYIYGINPVFEVVRAGKRKVYEAYLNKATAHQSRLRKLSQYLEKSGIAVQSVDKQRLADLSRHNKDHQGVVLKTSPYPYQPSDTMWGRPRWVSCSTLFTMFMEWMLQRLWPLVMTKG